MDMMNLKVFQEPRGLIRVIQFIFAILAFATTSSFDTDIEIRVNCPDEYKSVIEYKVEYPFKLGDNVITEKYNCTKGVPVFPQKFPMDFSSSAQFFVATGVLCFLYTIGCTVFYIFASKHYESNPLIPVMDLVATGVLTIFWLAASCAWAAGISDIKYYTNPKHLVTHINICLDKSGMCELVSFGKWAPLNISLIFGFANVFLWGASMWFVFKETTFHQKPTPMPMAGPGGEFVGQGGQPQFPQQQQQQSAQYYQPQQQQQQQQYPGGY